MVPTAAQVGATAPPAVLLLEPLPLEPLELPLPEEPELDEPLLLVLDAVPLLLEPELELDDAPLLELALPLEEEADPALVELVVEPLARALSSE